VFHIVGSDICNTTIQCTIFVNNQLDAQLFFMYVYSYSFGQPCPSSAKQENEI